MFRVVCCLRFGRLRIDSALRLSSFEGVGSLAEGWSGNC